MVAFLISFLHLNSPISGCEDYSACDEMTVAVMFVNIKHRSAMLPTQVTTNQELHTAKHERYMCESINVKSNYG